MLFLSIIFGGFLLERDDKKHSMHKLCALVLKKLDKFKDNLFLIDKINTSVVVVVLLLLSVCFFLYTRSPNFILLIREFAYCMKSLKSLSKLSLISSTSLQNIYTAFNFN